MLQVNKYYYMCDNDEDDDSGARMGSRTTCTRSRTKPVVFEGKSKASDHKNTRSRQQ